MAKRSRKTPQMVTVNRIFLVIGFVGVLAMVGYVYWDKNQHQMKSVQSQQVHP